MLLIISTTSPVPPASPSESIVSASLCGILSGIVQEPKTESGKTDIFLTATAYKALRVQKSIQLKNNLKLNGSFQLPDLVFQHTKELIYHQKICLGTFTYT